MLEPTSPQTDSLERLDLPNLTRSEFINAVVHLYRGELGEATAWRSRIDTTTHWAVVLSATALSFVYSDMSGERQIIIPVISFFCTFLMVMEARRYRFFDIWRSRARMIEINFYRPLLDGCQPEMKQWAHTLAQDMEWPRFHIPWWEAVGRRLRRSYQWIYAVLLFSWLVELSSHPTATTSFDEIIGRATVGPISGKIVFLGMIGFYIALAGLWIYSYWASRIKRESLPAGHPARMSAFYRE